MLKARFAERRRPKASLDNSFAIDYQAALLNATP
jgi:hypothetical protein